MKAIINGKRYDTTTATKIASFHNGCSCSDFRHCEETLYRTPKGAYFVHGEGGALSHYSTPYEGGRMRGRGERIIPKTDHEALGWLQEHEEVEVIEKLFPSAFEDA